MRSIFIFSYILCFFIECSSNTCGEQATFTVGPEGGTYEYCNWKFVTPPGAVSKTTTFTVQKSTVSVKHMTTIGLENPQTGQLETVPLELDTAPGFETIEVQIQDPSAIKNIANIAICPGTERMVSERVGANGTDTTATPVVGLDKNDPCFELFTNDTKLDEPVYLAAAGTDWSDSWNRLLSNSTELYNKYISGYAVVDPCVICSYGGFQLGSYLAPSDCQSFIKDQICTVTLPALAISLPLVLIPPLKQGICAAAKAAISGVIDFAISKLSGPKIGTVCNLFDSVTSLTIPAPLVRDGFGCSFQKSCDAITNCTAVSLNSKWIAGNISKCQEIGF